MRLIDADGFKKQIVAMAIANGYPPKKANAMCEIIDHQPTAYDIDVIVERLEKCFRRYYGSARWEEAYLTKKVLEIAKGGRIDE